MLLRDSLTYGKFGNTWNECSTTLTRLKLLFLRTYPFFSTNSGTADGIHYAGFENLVGLGDQCHAPPAHGSAQHGNDVGPDNEYALLA